jgi:hypothetical protein
VASLGYADPAYAESVAPGASIVRLASSGGSLVLGETCAHELTVRDAAGAYPVFDCLDWSGLADDIAGLNRDVVSVVLVSDAFAVSALSALHAAGAHVLRPYKEHYVVELDRPRIPFGRASRRRTAIRAQTGLEFAVVPGARADATEWARLYAQVVSRHAVRGAAAFSADALAAQLRLPGAVLLTARAGAELVAAQLCLRRGDVVYSHLAASSPEGYRRRAMHGLDLFALEHFRTRAAWFDFGGGRGGGVADGLAAYKASWATTTRPTWLAGWVLDASAYVRASGTEGPGSGYFPVYRDPQATGRGVTGPRSPRSSPCAS